MADTKPKTVRLAEIGHDLSTEFPIGEDTSAHAVQAMHTAARKKYNAHINERTGDPDLLSQIRTVYNQLELLAIKSHYLEQNGFSGNRVREHYEYLQQYEKMLYLIEQANEQPTTEEQHKMYDGDDSLSEGQVYLRRAAYYANDRSKYQCDGNVSVYDQIDNLVTGMHNCEQHAKSLNKDKVVWEMYEDEMKEAAETAAIYAHLCRKIYNANRS